MAEENLIELVRQQSVLYDTNNENYMKSKLKTRIWNDIAKELNLKDGDEAKKIWLRLRGSYRDAKRRQKLTMKSGSAAVNMKPWKYQKQMSFLENYIYCGQREGNLSMNESENEFVPDGRTPANSFENQELSNESILHEASSDGEQLVDDNAHNDRTGLKTSSMKPPNAMRKNNEVLSLIKRSVEQREQRARQREKERKTLESSKVDDPLYNFFISMWQTTKKMPSSHQHTVRAQIFQAVSNAEEAIINGNPGSPVFVSYTSTNSRASTPIFHSNPIEQGQDFQDKSDKFNSSNFMEEYIDEYE